MELIPFFLPLLLAASVHAQFDNRQFCLDKDIDIFFVLDSSTSIWINHYRQVVSFVSDIVSDLDIGPTRVGALSFSDNVHRQMVELTWYRSKSELQSMINLDRLPYLTGLTMTHEAIRHTRLQNFRQDAAKVMVILTDGESRIPSETMVEADLARREGFVIFVIGIGEYTNEEEWKRLANDPDSEFLFEIEDYDKLTPLRQQVVQRLCSMGATTTTTTTTTTTPKPTTPKPTTPPRRTRRPTRAPIPLTK